jgi:hypothetical protein
MERIRSAQLVALRALDKELAALYWDIGRMIAEKQTDGAHRDASVDQ